VSWDNLRLAAQTAGAEYGENTLRVAELLEKLSTNNDDPTPAVVWMYDPTDDKANRALESTTFQNEQIALALKKFRRFRVNVEEIGNRELREEYSKRLPAFHFFDPSGASIGEIAGRKATSLSGFSSMLDKTWKLSFESRMKTFARGMTKILDELDKLEAKKLLHAQGLERLKDKPNPRKERSLAKEGEELKQLEESILSDEKELLESVKIRPEFLSEESAAGER
jgi:hypothetical protein